VNIGGFAVYNGRHSHGGLGGGVKGQRVNKQRPHIVPGGFEIVRIKRDNIRDSLANGGGWVKLSGSGFSGFFAKLQHGCGGFSGFENQGGGGGVTVRDNRGGCSVCSHFEIQSSDNPGNPPAGHALLAWVNYNP
jgi:hypothetical protein